MSEERCKHDADAHYYTEQNPWKLKCGKCLEAEVRRLERQVEEQNAELSKLTDEPCPHCGRMMVPRRCRDHRRHGEAP